MKGTLDRICSMLEQGTGLIDENLISNFQTDSKSVAAELDSILESGRVLRIGIVGEVKAGKSSFLNALLFEGKDILPKAPTPMTAALTKLSYSDTPTAKVVFYTPEEWSGIEKRAKEYDQALDKLYTEYIQSCRQRQQEQRSSAVSRAKSVRTNSAPQTPQPEIKVLSKEEYERQNRECIATDEARACKEVVLLAEKQGISIYQYLGKETTVSQNINSGNYMACLSDYVGSSGRFTPIVKYTEIQLNNPALEGVEVIDTPGLNDPVLSRSRETEKFLIACDVVFMLSYCGQFLGAEDIEFITNTLPNQGIQRAVLIGSKLDATILQYPKRGATFPQAYRGTERNLVSQAEDHINDCLKLGSSKVLEQLKSSLPPILTSSLAYSAAMKRQKGERLSADESHMIENLCRFPGYQDTVEYLLNMANISTAKEKGFDETKVQKDKIIQERIRDLQNSQKARFLKALEDISIRTKSTREDLINYDCAQMEEQLADMKRRLDSSRVEVKSIFEQAAVNAKRTMADTVLEACDEMNNHLSIQVKTNTKTEHHSETSGHLFWKHTDHWDEIITTNLAEVRDVDENMRRYHSSCVRMINDGLRYLLNIDDIREQVKKAVGKAFDLNDRNFDANKILLPLESALGRLTLPEITIDMEKYTSLLDGKLEGYVTKGVVKNDDIPLLKRAQDQVLTQMAEDISAAAEKQGNKIANDLDEQAAVFIDNIEKELQGNQVRLEKLIDEKQENMKRLDDFLAQLKEAKAMLENI